MAWLWVSEILSIHRTCDLELSSSLFMTDFFFSFHVHHVHIQSIIDYGSTLWDSASANTTKPLVSLHKRALKAILLKTTTLTISDYNFLFVLPLKERLNYNKRQVAPSLTANFSLNQSRHSGKLYIPVPRTGLFKSSRVYSGSVLWNSLPDSLRLPSRTETFKSRYMSYVMRWLVARLQRSALLFPILHAFTHQ